MSRSPNTLSYSDINAAVHGGTDSGGNVFNGEAPDGETIILPTGEVTWAAGQKLAINANIKIIGNSTINTARTLFIDNTIIHVGSSGPSLTWTTTASTTTAFLQGVTFGIEANADTTILMGGRARFNGVNGGFRITQCHFNRPNGGGDKVIRIKDWATGLIDHCFYDVPPDLANGAGFMEMNTPAQPEFIGSFTARVGAFVPTNVSLTIASPGVVTLSGHNLKEGQGVMFASGTTLPIGAQSNKVYFVKTPSTNTFNISATPFATAINFSGSQSGQQQLLVCNNIPKAGLYSYAYPWVWGNDFSGVYVEDCILHKHGFGILQADGPQQDQGGGSRIVMRHCSSWGAFSGHGFDESGGNTGIRVMESYNNFLYSPDIAKAPLYHNIRAGTIVCFNERILNHKTNQLTPVGACDFFRASQPDFKVCGPMDGTNFLDLNARGGKVTIKTTLPTSQIWEPWETETTGTQTLSGSFTLNVVNNTAFPSSGILYVNTGASGASGTQPVNYSAKPTSTTFTCTYTYSGTDAAPGASIPAGSAVVGPLNIVIAPANAKWGASDRTYPPIIKQIGGRPGVPTDVRIGAVYAQGIGGSDNLAGVPSGGSVVYTLPIAVGAANHWVGFSIVNRTKALPRTEADGGAGDNANTTPNIICNHFVTASTVGASTSTLTGNAPHDDKSVHTLASGDQWELRYPIAGVGQPGGGTIPFTDGDVADGGVQFSYFEANSNNQNRYWGPQEAVGIWAWGCRSCTTAGGVTAIARLANGNAVDANFTFDDNPNCGMNRMIQGGVNNTPKPAYQTRTATPDSLRIGADWDSGTFGGKKSDGNWINADASTVSAIILSTDTKWPGATTAYGASYPHPLIATPVNSPPSIPTTGSATFTAGVANTTLAITASGSPYPTFSITAGSPPAWVSISSSTGAVSVTTSSVIGVYDFTITASNTPGVNTGTDTQAFELTITAGNAAPTCSITSPAAPNLSFLTTDTIGIEVTTSDSDGSVVQVVIKDGTTTLNTATSLTTPPLTTPKYTYSATFASGNHSLTAIATDNGGASTTSTAVAITVTVPVTPTLQPPTIVVTG